MQTEIIKKEKTTLPQELSEIIFKRKSLDNLGKDLQAIYCLSKTTLF